MTLDNLLRIGKVKAHAADKVEIGRLLASAERALADAGVPGVPVSDTVAQECAADARKVLDQVRAWLAAHRPDLV